MGHQSIRFVIPKVSSNSNTLESPMSLDDPPGSHLDAVTVLSGFVKSLKLNAPPLFDDPLRFFAVQIKNDIHPEEDHRNDIYNLKTLVAKIESAAERNEGARQQNNSIETNATLIEKVLNAVRKANSHEALNICERITSATLNAAQRDDLIDSLAYVLRDLRSRNANLALQACDWSLTFSGDIDDADISEAREAAIVHASFIKGELLMQMERNGEAVTAFDLCIKSGRKFKHDMPKRSTVAEALFGKGLALDSLERSSEAIDTYNELWGSYTDRGRQNRRVRRLLARARTNQGMAYQNSDPGDTTRYDRALACFREVLEKFGNETDERFYEPVAKSLVHMGMILYQQRHIEEAIQVYDKVLDRFGSISTAALQDPLVKALANKGMALEKLGRNDDALNCYNEMERRIGPVPDAFFHPVLAGILHRKGRLLGLQGNHEQALACFDKALKYSDESDPHRAQILADRNAVLRKLGRDEGA